MCHIKFPAVLLNQCFRLFFPKSSILQAWQKADVDDETFLDENRMELSNLIIGHSYSPEHVEFLKSFYPEFRDVNLTPVQILDFLHKELNLRTVRIGIRWSEVAKGSSLDLSMYVDCIKYCLDRNIDLCLNIGPFKVFRWPEIHIPEHLADVSEYKKSRSIISSTGVIYEESLRYLDNLFVEFTKAFGRDFVEKITCIQNDNEAFNTFGDRLWNPSISLESEITQLTLKYFRNSKVLISFSGGPNWRNLFAPELGKVFKLVDAISKYLQLSRLILGLNYYYAIPGYPFVADDVRVDNISLFKFIYGNKLIDHIRSLSLKYQIPVEVTELQFEPWGDVASPGNSVRELKYALLRVCEEIKSMCVSDRTNVRLWGTELFALRLLTCPSSELVRIKKLISSINRLSQ